MRIGFGYDVHPLVKDRKLILGGVGDIGSHFPDTDEKYRDISSLILLQETGKILANQKFHIINIDSTIVLEKPKLQKYIPEMKSNIADKLDIKPEQVSIKATREEGLGFVGTGVLKRVTSPIQSGIRETNFQHNETCEKFSARWRIVFALRIVRSLVK